LVGLDKTGAKGSHSLTPVVIEAKARKGEEGRRERKDAK
jgi:hypothetical protein